VATTYAPGNFSETETHALPAAKESMFKLQVRQCKYTHTTAHTYSDIRHSFIARSVYGLRSREKRTERGGGGGKRRGCIDDNIHSFDQTAEDVNNNHEATTTFIMPQCPYHLLSLLHLLQQRSLQRTATATATASAAATVTTTAFAVKPLGRRWKTRRSVDRPIAVKNQIEPR